MPDELFRLSDVPIFEVGTWNGDVYSEADLDAIVAAYGKVGFRPPLKLGHDESQPLAKSDGMPALGWVENLKRSGKRLLADFANLPRVVADAVRRRAYDRVSAEIYWDYQEQQQRWPRVLKAVALLGAEIPAVTSLPMLQTLYDAGKRPFRRYYMDTMGSGPASPSFMPPMPMQPKLAKADVKYQKAAADAPERCGACKFFLGPPDPNGTQNWLGSCAIVDGEIASGMVCGQFHVREAFEEYAQPSPKGGNPFAPKGSDADARNANAAGLTVEELDGQHCVMAKGEKQRCFPTPEEADAYVQSLTRTSDAKPIKDEANSAASEGDGDGEMMGAEGGDGAARDAGADLVDKAIDGMMDALLGEIAARIKARTGNEEPTEDDPDEEVQEYVRAVKMPKARRRRTYTIEKRGRQWCLLAKSTGKTLGCHETEDDALAQERAVQASKRGFARSDGTVEYRFTLDQVERWCAPCAEHMRFKNLKLLKVTYDPKAKIYAGFSQGMCDKFGEPAGFRTRCMDAMAGNVDDEGAFCNALKAHCHGDVTAGDEKKATIDQAARFAAAADATVTGAAHGGQASKEDGDVTEKEYAEKIAQLELDKKEAEARADKAEAEAKEFSVKATEAEATIAGQREAARVASNKAWVEGLAGGAAPKILPAERPFVEYVLDILTAPAGAKVKAYSHNGKDLAPAETFKHLYELREGFAAELFAEKAAGGGTERAAAGAVGSGADARAKTHELTKQYIANAAKSGGKVAYETAYRAVVNEHPDLKTALYGARPEGARKQAEGAAERARLTGEGK